MNNEKLGATPQMYVGGDTKQAIEFAWPNTSYAHCISTCNEIKGSYDKITFTIVPSYTGNNCQRFLIDSHTFTRVRRMINTYK